METTSVFSFSGDALNRAVVFLQDSSYIAAAQVLVILPDEAFVVFL